MQWFGAITFFWRILNFPSRSHSYYLGEYMKRITETYSGQITRFWVCNLVFLLPWDSVKNHQDTKSSVNLESWGTSGIDPSVSVLSLIKAQVHEIGPCLQFNKAWRLMKAWETCAWDKALQIQIYLVHKTFDTPKTGIKYLEEVGIYIFHNKLEAASSLWSVFPFGFLKVPLH